MPAFQRMITAMTAAAYLAAGTSPAGDARRPLLPSVEVEELLYRYKPADNGAGPLWGNASTCIVRIGDRVFASGLETLDGVPPLNNVRWLLFQRRGAPWRRVAADPEGRTREPCPLAAFPDGRLFLSVNPTLTPLGARNGPARPEILEFAAANPGRPRKILEPVWDGRPSFTEHSYRSFAADGPNRELILFQNVGYDHAEWAFYDRSGQWTARGKLRFPWGAEYDPPKPVRLCYPAVALKNRSVYWLGVSDVTEPNPAWHAYKKKITGREWDYDFRRLFFTWSPDIRRGKFHPWLEIASRDKTAGWIFPCDLWIAPGGDVHLLWIERAIDERLRPKFFPNAKQEWQLNHAVVRNGRVIRRQTLVRGGEGISGVLPGIGRFQVAPDNRLFVFYYCHGRDERGRPVSENRVLEIYPGNGHSPPVDVPLQYPFSHFINATVRAGCAPSATLDILGQAPGQPGISYARINLLAAVRAEPRIRVQRRAAENRLELDGSRSRAARGRIRAWRWDLDGTRLEGEKTQCELRRSGAVPITLTVQDSNGLADSARRILRLPPLPSDFGLRRWGLVLRTEAEAFTGQTGGSVREESEIRNASALVVTGWNHAGQTVTWTFEVPVTDHYFAVFHYTAPNSARRRLVIDDKTAFGVHFPSTGSHSTPQTDAWGFTPLRNAAGAPVALPLDKGAHTLRLETPDDSDLALDYIDWIAQNADSNTPAGPDLEPRTDGAYRWLLPRSGRIRTADIHAELGHCFIAPIGPNYPGDGLENQPPSTLILFENGKPLGPAHTLHRDIRSRGKGRYSHWKTQIYFSTSDNSDPRTNGRVYTWRIPARPGT